MLSEKRIRHYQQKIDQLGDWYQPIEFIKNRLKSKTRYDFNSTIQGINKWDFLIRKNLPKKLEGLRILDLGCASGLFSMACAREGANVIGIELDDDGYKQAMLSREIYSEIDGVNYEDKFKIIKQDFTGFDWEKYEKFDIVLALNVLYWVEVPYEKVSMEDRKKYTSKTLSDLMKKIRANSKMLVVQADENKYWRRVRDKKSLEATNSKSVVELLEKSGFKSIRIKKPVALKSMFRTLFSASPEVDLKKPIFYARPIIIATP